MYYDNVPMDKRRAELLEKSTPSERDACRLLSCMSIHYIRQYPVWTGRRMYYADIYIPRYKLILEIDGKYHFTENQKRLDCNRSSSLRRLGYHVCRLTNAEAKQPAKIVSKLRRYMKSV